MTDQLEYHMINVATAVDRREQMDGEFERAGLAGRVQVFDAITPATLDRVPSKYNEQTSRLLFRRPQRDTEMGCSLSHLALWRQLIASSAAAYVIVEDDALIDPDLPAVADALLESYREGRHSGCVRLSTQNEVPTISRTPLTEGRELARLRRVGLGTAGYFITSEAAEQMLPHCERLWACIDRMMTHHWAYGLPIHAVLPYPVQHRPDVVSLIGDEQRTSKGEIVSLKNLYASRSFKLLDRIAQRVPQAVTHRLARSVASRHRRAA